MSAPVPVCPAESVRAALPVLAVDSAIALRIFSVLDFLIGFRPYVPATHNLRQELLRKGHRCIRTACPGSPCCCWLLPLWRYSRSAAQARELVKRLRRPRQSRVLPHHRHPYRRRLRALATPRPPRALRHRRRQVRRPTPRSRRCPLQRLTQPRRLHRTQRRCLPQLPRLRRTQRLPPHPHLRPTPQPRHYPSPHPRRWLEPRQFQSRFLSQSGHLPRSGLPFLRGRVTPAS